MAEQLTAQQRAALFAQATRQTIQTMPSQSVTAENTSLQFTLPKARLLSKIYLEVEAAYNLKHASVTTVPTKMGGLYNTLRRVSLDLNNGFSPFIIPGRDLAIYNLNRLHPEQVLESQSRGMYEAGVTASSGGTANTGRFMIELPVALNDRDPVGLILLQSNETNVTLTVDVATIAAAFNQASLEATLTSLKVTPVLETFTIPALEQAMPDLSVLKLVNSKTDTFAGNGQNIVKLNVGTIYRKLMLYVEDSNGTPFADSDFTSNIELVFNQADIPYSVKASVLSARQASQLGYALPEGVFILDFSNQGIPNLGGTRDAIDTERLTEFWVRFNSTKAGKLTVISETLSRLR